MDDNIDVIFEDGNESDDEAEMETASEMSCDEDGNGSDSSECYDDNNEQLVTEANSSCCGVQRRGVRVRGGKFGRGISRTTCNNGWIYQDSFNPTVPHFKEKVGAKFKVPQNPTEVFKHFVDDTLIDMIVDQTNLYARQYISKNRISKHSRVAAWKETERDEMYRFFALSILMGLNQKPTIPDFWSKRSIYHNPLFHQTMSRNRYQLILRFLHFNDNTYYEINNPDRDRLYKVRPVLDYLVGKFQASYCPSQNVAIDEQLLKFKGRVGFRIYIRTKKAKFGIKFFSLCDEKGYVFNTAIYSGKNSIKCNKENKELGKSGQVRLIYLYYKIESNGLMGFLTKIFSPFR